MIGQVRYRPSYDLIHSDLNQLLIKNSCRNLATAVDMIGTENQRMTADRVVAGCGSCLHQQSAMCSTESRLVAEVMPTPAVPEAAVADFEASVAAKSVPDAD